MTNPEIYEKLHSALNYLSARCDGAREEDGQGFNGRDSDFGKSLANQDYTKWSPKQGLAAWRVCSTYRKTQLSAFDFPPKPTEQDTRKRTNGWTPPAEKYLGEINGAFVMCTTPDGVYPSRDLMEAIKEGVDGWSFRKTPKPAWHLPISSAAQILAQVEAERIELVKGVKEILEKQAGGLVDAAGLSRASEGSIKIEGLGITPMPFQEAGIQYCMSGSAAVVDVRTMIADDMGLGKTYQALAVYLEAMNRLKRRGVAIVVCPKSVLISWARSARAAIPDLGKIMIVKKTKPEPIPSDVEMMIFTYDRLKGKGWVEAVAEIEPIAVIFDESQMIKNRSARTTAAKRLSKLKSIRVKLALTGTPVENGNPMELWSQLQAIGRDRDVGGWKGFTERYTYRDNWGGYHGQNMEALNDKLREMGAFVRRMKDEVLTELPPLVTARVPLEIKRGAYNKALAKTKRDILAGRIEMRRAAKEGREPEGWAVAASVVAIGELRKAVAHAKLPEAIDWCKGVIESGEKIIVGAHHTEIVDGLAASLNAPCIQGSTSETARQAAVDRFQTDDDCRCIVLQISAGGVGITLTAASNVAIVESPWTPAKIDQLIDRSRRIGQDKSVTAWMLEADDTIDVKLGQIIANKRILNAEVTDGNVSRSSVMNELIDSIGE